MQKKEKGTEERYGEDKGNLRARNSLREGTRLPEQL
jgi:hypothetical protein